jgi:Ca2+-binding RTX toxin-like protein
MAGPLVVSLTSDEEINALLTGYKWDTPNLTYSFPDSGWWYVLEQVADELSPLSVVEALAAWVTDPVGKVIDTLVDAVLGPFADTAVVALLSLPGFEEFTVAEQAAAKRALDNVMSFTFLNFQKVDEGKFFFELLPPDGPDFGFTHGVLRYAETGALSAPGLGFPPLERVQTLLGNGVLGDAWFTNSDARFDNAVPGNFGAFTIMHETGHALGLKHAHETGLLGGRLDILGSNLFEQALTGVNGPIMPANHDTVEWTVMSYISAPGGGPGGYTLAADSYPTTFMMLDIKALQYLYGADYTYNADNTVYTWNPETGEMSLNGVPQGPPAGNKVFMTVWDGGGNDTYDLSGYTEAGTIDLRPGEWSTTSQRQRAMLNPANNTLAIGTVANALLHDNNPASLIENAFGGSGNDTIIGNDLANLLRGNGSNDSITGGLAADTIEGGAGNDTLDGGADNDTLNGGDDNDSIVGAEGNDSIDGGSGNDTVSAGMGLDTVFAGEGDDSLDGGAENDTLVGGNGNDTIIGGDGDDTIDAGFGNDTVTGGAGRDTIHAGDGNDSVDGGSDDDELFGEDGNDTIDGGDGSDLITGDAGNDSITAGAGNDSVSGADGNDTLIGATGFDTIDGGTGFDFINGGDNDDTLTAGSGDDTVIGGLGNDTIQAGDGSDSVFAGAGLDTVEGGFGNDTVFGDDGEDQIYGGAGLDLIDGGVGSDYLDGGLDNDTITGGEGNDTIVGADGSDSIDGGLGADSIAAGSDNDTVSGGADNDTVNGGDGNDFLAGDDGNDLILGGLGLDVISGGIGNDDLFGGDGVDSLSGNEGNDTLAGGTGPDTVDGGDGIDMASYSDATGPVVINLQDPSQTTGDAQGDLLISIEQFGLSEFGDTFIGLNDPLVGDVVFGRGGNDTLLGFAGNDTLHGDNGDDYIVGSLGADEIDGGDGFDTTSFLESKIGIVVDLVNPARSTGIATGDTIVSVEQFLMTQQNDEFVGSDTGETVFAYGGNDLIFGGGGGDRIFGGEQHDQLFGGTGSDELLGEAGNDMLDGGADGDVLDGGADIDILFGGSGADALRGGAGNDFLSGDEGDDILYGGEGRDDFAFRSVGWGVDIIEDFQDGVDRIDVQGLVPTGMKGFKDFVISERIGAGGGIETVIQLAAGGGDQIVLAGVSAQSINHQDFAHL